MNFKKSFDYEFIGELEYVKEGKGLVKANKITIKAPKNCNAQNSLIIEKEFKKAQLKALSELNKITNQNEEKTKSSSTTTTSDIDSNVIIDIIMSGDGDVDKCFSSLRNILCSGSKNNPVSFIDDVEPFTQIIFDEMDLRDAKNILGEYILNFLHTSLLN